MMLLILLQVKMRMRTIEADTVIVNSYLSVPNQGHTWEDALWMLAIGAAIYFVLLGISKLWDAT